MAVKMSEFLKQTLKKMRFLSANLHFSIEEFDEVREFIQLSHLEMIFIIKAVVSSYKSEYLFFLRTVEQEALSTRLT